MMTYVHLEILFFLLSLYATALFSEFTLKSFFFFSNLDCNECLYNPNFSLCSEMMRKDASLKSLSAFKMLFPNTPAEMCKKVLRLQEHRVLNDKQPNGKMVFSFPL